jgi:hypothetical protein
MQLETTKTRVTRGLDPRVHRAAVIMDRRVKPGDDALWKERACIPQPREAESADRP